MSLTPTVAIVGRPNVGKSTLFNRLLGRRQAIVHDLPGITRDRITGIAHLNDDRPIQIVDTGGLVPGDDPLGLNEQVFLAVEESDLLLFVVDGRQGLVSADEEVWSHFRRSGKPALLVVNKADTREARNRFPEFYSLGIDQQILISAEHGAGIEDLREALALTLPEIPDIPTPDAPPIAIVGRPNVGKSSLLNKISGLNRALVSPVAGTTRDPVDTVITRGDKSYLLIDTAGIRRRSQVTGAPEELAVMMARRQIERAQVVVLVIDASQSVTGGDLTIAGTIWELGRAAVVAINKWDLLDDEGREKLEFDFQRLDELLASPGRVNVSALSGRGVEKLWPPIDRALDSYNLKLSTGQLNRLFERFIKKVAAPSLTGTPWKLYYVTQVSSAPPTFMLFANRTLPRNHHYRRYLENRLREELGLPGVPLRLVVRKRTE
ncbi:MAG TPA: ribosome biogenesis GTPase Der [Thermoanaerobaculia bacterium]|nr:ribosome biogenesis GTPase Der [Thermoanaerobaculia bacterium]